MKKTLILGTILALAITSTTFAADDISALLNSMSKTGSTATGSVATGTSNSADISALLSGISTESTTPSTPTNTYAVTVPEQPTTIDVVNGSWKQTLKDSSILLFFKVNKTMPVENTFTISYQNDVGTMTTVQGSELKKYFDMAITRAGQEMTLKSGEIKTVQAGDELKIQLAPQSGVSNKEVTYNVVSGITPDRFGEIDVALGSVKILGIYAIQGDMPILSTPTENIAETSFGTAEMVENSVVPETPTGAEDNVMFIALALIALVGTGAFYMKKETI